MKIIMPKHKVADIKIGDRFLNTTWTVSGQWYRTIRSGRSRTYVPVTCDCGYSDDVRWDDLHTTDPDRSPWSSRCPKCGAGKPREKECIRHNRAKSADETPQNKVDDLTGRQIGDLYVVKRLGTDSQSHSIYECRCGCGRTQVFPRNALVKGKNHGPRMACSECLRKVSNGEKTIKNYLDKKGFKYKQQYVFDDLMGDGGHLRFDFALLDGFNQPYALIEFQGIQHYQPVEFFGGQAQFEKQQRYDQLKRDYCRKKGIKLVEIPYDKVFEGK